VNARKPIIAEPPARPSRPSVTLTALLVAQIITPVKTTKTGIARCQPGKVARVIDSVWLTSVEDTNHHASSIERPSVM